MIRAALALLAIALPAQQPQPYVDPPFACEVIDYGTEPPTVPAPADDPLCVRYDKTNITVSTLGVVDFLAAEPGRVAIVAGKCSYWQQDHWIVRATPDTPPIVEWEGSYWYDGRTGSAGGIVRNLHVGGEPADGQAFAEAMAPLIGEEAAQQLASYAAEGGGGGASFALPEGFGAEVCPDAAGASTTTSTTSTTTAPATPTSTAAISGTTSDSELARTGTGVDPTVALGAAAAALAVRRLRRRT